MKPRRSYYLFWLLLVGIAFASCQRPEEDEEVVEIKPQPAVSPTLTTAPVAVATKSRPVELGRIIDLAPEVAVRRSAEWAWNTVTKGLPVYPFDAVRTQPSGKAHILLADGTVLEIREDSLVILPDSLKGAYPIDRAVARHGTVRGQTKRELWILTSAALFRLKAKKDGQKSAQATLSVQEGKHMRVELEEGEGEIVGTRMKQGKQVAFRAAVFPRQPVVIKAPEARQDFGVNTDESVWTGPQQVETVKIQEIAVVPTRTPAPPPVKAKLKPSTPAPELLIVSPRNYAEVSQETIALTGKAPGLQGEIRVNGKLVPIANDGSFTTPLVLKPGANNFFVEWVPKQGPAKFKNWILIRK